jgi:hypothetical protein
MDNINSGPEWLWKLIFFFGALGFIGAIVGAIWGIVWLFNHVKFV